MSDRRPPPELEDAVHQQAAAVVDALWTAVPAGTVVGAYLYGSAVAGGLRSDSDLDILGVVDRRLTDGERDAVVASLLPISGRRTRPPAWRPVELTVVVAGEVRPWRYPPRHDLQYGEWLREDALAGRLVAPPSSPDLAILLAMVRRDSRPLIGPPAADLLDPVPHGDVIRAIRDEVAPLRSELETDTRNVLLTLARMWSTVVTGELVSKDVAATWAAARLPARQADVLVTAGAAYLAGGDGRWAATMPIVRDAADVMAVAIGALPPADASV